MIVGEFLGKKGVIVTCLDEVMECVFEGTWLDLILEFDGDHESLSVIVMPEACHAVRLKKTKTGGNNEIDKT